MELLFIVIRLPFFIIAIVVVFLYWFVYFSGLLVGGSIASLPIIIFCALFNSENTLNQWLDYFGKGRRNTLSKWKNSMNMCWNYLLGDKDYLL
jgi:hypothetical protein